MRDILQDAIEAVRGWQGDPYYAWAWPHARGKVADALRAAAQPGKVLADPEALQALRALYGAALRAGIPIPHGVGELISRGRR